MSIRYRLLGGAGIFALGAVMGGSAAAQTADDALDVVTVTAQKREESLQEVPISLTAFTEEDLIEGGIETLSDYSVLTPSLTIDTGRNGSDAEVNIRGIGSNVGGSQNLYGVYLDGVELTGATRRIVSMALLDVERVEVLRGPQGTAFGRNVMAGAINLTSTTPTYEFGGNSEFEAGDYGSLSTKHAVNIPLADGVAAARISGRYSTTDGYLENSGAAGGSNDSEVYTLRGSLFFEPAENFRAKLILAYDDESFGLSNEVPTGATIGAARQLQNAVDAGYGGTAFPPGSLPAGPDIYFPHQDTHVSIDHPSAEEVENFVAIANATYDLADGRISWINVAGYIDSKFDQTLDLDRTNYAILDQEVHSSSEFMSFESRLQSNGAGPFGWTVGGYHSRAEGESQTYWNTGADAGLVTLGAFPSNFSGITDSADESEDSAWAVFGDASYELTEKLTLAGGLRYNWDEQRGVRPVPGLSLGSPLAPFDATLESEQLTWRANVQYQASDNAHLYGAVSTGYRAGGLQPLNVVRPSYGPEEMINYELGAKVTTFDGRVRINAAVFQMDWNDVQITTVDRVSGGAFTDNAGAASIQGVELDLTARFGRWDIIGGLSYLDSEIEEFIDSAGYDQSGNPLPDAAELSSSLAVQYTHPINSSLDGFVRGVFIQTTERLEDLIEGGVDPVQYAPGYERYDLRAGIQADAWRLEVYAENLLDEEIATGIQTAGASFAGALVNVFPRRIGARLRLTY